MQSRRPLLFRLFEDEEDRRRAALHERSRIAMQGIVANLDACCNSKDLFVHFVGDAWVL